MPRLNDEGNIVGSIRDKQSQCSDIFYQQASSFNVTLIENKEVRLFPVLHSTSRIL